MSTGTSNGSAVWALGIYQDSIYAGSSFYFPQSYNGLSNGLTAIGILLDGGINHLVQCMTTNNGSLYVGGLFTKAGNDSTEGVAKWDGHQWSGFPFDFQSASYFPMTLAFYQNNLYIGGNFYYNTGMNDMCYWDGNTMQSIGGGLMGGVSSVNNMVEYNGELYIGGYFYKSDGNVGDYIMKWNGNVLSEVNSGLDGPVFSMKVYNGILYVAAVFLMLVVLLQAILQNGTEIIGLHLTILFSIIQLAQLIFWMANYMQLVGLIK